MIELIVFVTATVLIYVLIVISFIRMLTPGRPDAGKFVRIICPNCGIEFTAFIKYESPWNDYTNECKNCGYWVTESDFQPVEESNE